MVSNQSFVSPEVAQQWRDITSGIMQAGTRPYQAYGGPFLAAPTEMEAAAQAAYGAYGKGAGPESTLQAASTMREAARGIGSLAPEQAAMARKFGAYAPLAQEQAQAAAAGMAGTGAEAAARARGIGERAAAPELQREAGALDPYVSQYTEGVLDPQIQAIRDEAKRARAETGAQAAQAGAFGGYRHGLVEAEGAQAATQQIADVTGKAYADAQREARSAFEADRAAQFAGTGQQLSAEQQATTGQQTAQQAAAALQQRGFGTMADLWGGQQAALGGEAGLYGQQLATGRAFGEAGQREQAQQLERWRQMQMSGKGQRQVTQAGYDIAREEWEKARQDPEKRIDWMRRQMSGLPYQNIMQQSTYGPQVGPVGRALGTGLAGAGMWLAQDRPKGTAAGSTAYDRTDPRIGGGYQGWQGLDPNAVGDPYLWGGIPR
jgi:hypothetical protein